MYFRVFLVSQQATWVVDVMVDQERRQKETHYNIWNMLTGFPVVRLIIYAPAHIYVCWVYRS